MLIFFAILINGCSESILNTKNQDSKPLPYFENEFSIVGEPKLNNIVEVKLTVRSKLSYLTSEINGNKMKLVILLPEGIEKVDGELKWEGDLEAYGNHTITAKIRPIANGYYELKGLSSLSSTEFISSLYLEAMKDSGRVSEVPLIDEKVPDDEVNRGIPANGAPQNWQDAKANQ